VAPWIWQLIQFILTLILAVLTLLNQG